MDSKQDDKLTQERFEKAALEHARAVNEETPDG